MHIAKSTEKTEGSDMILAIGGKLKSFELAGFSKLKKMLRRRHSLMTSAEK